MKAKIKWNKGKKDPCLQFKVVYYDKRKVTSVSCICVPIQIWKVTHKYKKEVENYKKSFTYCYTHKKGREVTTCTLQQNKGSHV